MMTSQKANQVMAIQEEVGEVLEGSQEDIQGSQNNDQNKGNDGGLPKMTVNFTQVEVQGEIKFKCGACDKMCDKETYIKGHIKRVHMTKKIPAEKRERDKNETEESEGNKIPASQDVMKYVGISGAAEPSIEDVLNYNKPEVTAEVDKTHVEVVEEMDVDKTLKAEIEALKEEVITMKVEMAELKQENETKTELLEAKTGR